LSIRIGIVGPEDSVKQILSVTKDFPDVEFISFMYEDVYQVDELIQNNPESIDQWFFSGVLNYHYAIENNLVHEDIAIYPPLYGSSFFATLLAAQLQEKEVFTRVSIDSIEDEELKKTFPYYRLDSLTHYNFPFTDYTYIHELADFHERLYRQGKTEIAITSTNYAYVRLREKNVPVYRLKPSYLSIQLSLNVLIERAYVKRLKKTQMGIIGCYADLQVKDYESSRDAYQRKQDELTIKKELIHLAEKVKGSFISVGNGLFLIYTNRGEIDQEAKSFIFLLADKIEATCDVPIRFSIGYGESASKAEEHTYAGLKETLQEESMIIVDEHENRTILARKDLGHLEHPTISLSEDWQEKLKDINISTSTVSRLVSLANYYHKREFTSQDISDWLKCSTRNARRILLQLERGDIVRQCGERHTGSRGRPLKLYCFSKGE